MGQRTEWVVQRLSNINVVVMRSDTELFRVLRCVYRIGLNLICDACNRQRELTVQQSVNSAPYCVHFDAVFCPITKHELLWFGCIEEALKCLG